MPQKIRILLKQQQAPPPKPLLLIDLCGTKIISGI